MIVEYILLFLNTCLINCQLNSNHHIVKHRQFSRRDDSSSINLECQVNFYNLPFTWKHIDAHWKNGNLAIMYSLLQVANNIFKDIDINGDGKSDNFLLGFGFEREMDSNSAQASSLEKLKNLFHQEIKSKDDQLATNMLESCLHVVLFDENFETDIQREASCVHETYNFISMYPVRNSYHYIGYYFSHHIAKALGADIDQEGCKTSDPSIISVMHPLFHDILKYVPNKFKFGLSDCSKSAIEKYLSKKTMKYTWCLKKKASNCGNGIKEAGEECDCGASENCKRIDNCCTPNVCSYKKKSNWCNKTEACCGTSCEPIQAHQLCSGECFKKSKCDGETGKCPKSQVRYDKECFLCLEKPCHCNANGYCVSKMTYKSNQSVYTIVISCLTFVLLIAIIALFAYYRAHWNTWYPWKQHKKTGTNDQWKRSSTQSRKGDEVELTELTTPMLNKEASFKGDRPGSFRGERVGSFREGGRPGSFQDDDKLKRQKSRNRLSRDVRMDEVIKQLEVKHQGD